METKLNCFTYKELVNCVKDELANTQSEQMWAYKYFNQLE